MSDTNLFFDQFDYSNKSFALKAADFCNQGVYALFNGRRINLYKDIDGELSYTLLKPRPFALALLITALVLPLLFITLPLKLFSAEQAKLEMTFKHLEHRQEVMSKLKRQWAATKIQIAFQHYVERKKAKKEEQDKKKWINRVRSYINPYLPLIKKQVFSLAVEGIRFAQQKAVHLICDAITIELCTIAGVDPADVKLAVNIEKAQAKYGF